MYFAVFFIRCHKQGQSSDGRCRQTCLHYQLFTYKVQSISVNDHQETDSRICLHVDDALNEGATTVLDVVIVGRNLSRSCPAPSRNAVMGRLWHREDLPLLPHQLNLTRTWGGESSLFAIIHPFSDSYATSQFSGKGKKSAWKAGKTYPAATAGFTSASQDGFVPLEFISASFRLTERSTCIR